jgi:signal transduction histidine kinase
MDGPDDDRAQPRDEVLGDADFDQLLREVLVRVHGLLDEQERLRHVLDAVVAISSELSLDGVLNRILGAARSLVGARYAALGVPSDGPDRRLRTFVHQGMDDETVARIGELPSGHGLLGVLVDDPRPIRLRDLSAHPAAYGFPEHHPPMTSFLGVPVASGDRVFGNLYLTEKEGGHEFTEQDEAVVRALAAAAGVALEHVELYEDAARRQAWLEATAEITSLLADDTSADLALHVVADRARALSGADVSWVVTGADPASLHLEAVSGAPADLSSMRELRMEESLASIVIRTGEAVAVDDLGSDPRAVDPSSLEGWPRLGPVIVLPLRSNRGVEGVLSLAWTPEHLADYHRVDPALPASFAEQATLALQVARVREDRQRLTLLEERDRIGRDLHDLVIQRLFAVGLGLQSTLKLTPDGEVVERLQRGIDDIDDTIKDIRRTIFALGALDSATDVQSEMEGLVERAATVMKLRPRLRIDGPLRTAVTDDLAPDLLAVLSEALTNVGRHAHASSVDVRVSVGSDAIELGVTDDGRGMAPHIQESGLRNMRARAERHGGDLEVGPAEGGGTSVRWRVPLVW